MSLNDVLLPSSTGSVISLSGDNIFTHQALEREQFISNFDSKWYKCHLISATVKKYYNDPDNVIYASWNFHQLFDGLNTQAGVGVAVKFDHIGDCEEILIGDKFERRCKIFVVVQFIDRDVANFFGNILKDGTMRIDDYSYLSFLFAKDPDRMKYCLEQKFETVKHLFEDDENSLA
jgi:hypothetical protein